tara:strand:+ start:141 stop:686 length:546 start_codon:yes stop_codon:yes gene_type:complete
MIKKLPKYLSNQEIQELFIFAPSEKIRLLMYIQFFLGARINEAVNLKPADISFKNNQAMIIDGKGGKDRILPLPARLKEKLYNQKVAATKPYVKMTRQNANRLYKAAYAAAVENNKEYPIFEFSSHVFRHSAIRFWVETIKDINKVQLLAGHSKLETTELYTRLRPGHDIDIRELNSSSFR